jgi:hypothetical protein
MHRSGTSFLTGSLQKFGLELGKHHEWNPHNRKGNRENQDIVDLHDAVLASNNGSWDHPPPRATWQPAQIARAEELLASYADSPCWGFKDPRALLLIAQWQKMVPDMQYIGIYRHPMAVATSLKKRGHLPIEDGLELWRQYNKRLLQEHKSHPFPLLCFDWDEQLLQEKLGRAARQLGLSDNSQESPFYESDLRHHNFSDLDGLPWRVRRLYRQLQKRTF